MYVGGLEVEEVEEGSVVHGGHGPCRGGSRGIRGEAVCEGEVREDAGAQRGKRSGEDAGREGLGGGPELGLARCARRGGSRRGRRSRFECWMQRRPLGAAVSLELFAW